MLAKIKEKREKRAKLIAQVREIANKEGAPTAEDNLQMDEMLAEANELKADIDRLERLVDAENDLATRVDTRAGREDLTTGEAARDIEAESQAFTAFLRGGITGLDGDQRQLMMARREQMNIQAAQGVGTDSTGGYLVPEDFRAKLEQAMQAFGGVREVATILPTAGGNDLPMPTVNDAANKGAILAEQAADSEQGITFGSLTLGAYKYTSKIVLVSIELLQDSAIGVDGIVSGLLGERLARIYNEHFTTGTGTSQPNGIVTAATLGKTGASGQTTSVTVDDLVDLEHSVDPAYRNTARFMFKDSTLKAIKKLKDGDDRPMWTSGLAFKEPDSILGYPFVINQDMAAMAINAKSILFGDMSKYLIRDVLGIQMVRLSERYAEKFQVAFIAFGRTDADLLDAGTHPVRYYANSAA